ncbi:hypothetical protein V6N13_094101 [Hibiscus sabdariffa]
MFLLMESIASMLYDQSIADMVDVERGMVVGVFSTLAAIGYFAPNFWVKGSSHVIDADGFGWQATRDHKFTIKSAYLL